MMQQFIIVDSDPDYEPTMEEIIQYAQYLGKIKENDKGCLRVQTMEGLKSPLPHPWKEAHMPDGDVLFYNPESQILQEEHPLDHFFKRKFIDAKKQASKSQEPSKVQKKLKSLCEIQRKEINKNIEFGDDVNKSTLQQSFDENRMMEDEILKYERFAVLELEKYKERKQKQIEDELLEFSNSQDGIESQEMNFAEVSLYQRDKFIEQKELLDSKIKHEFEQKFENIKQNLFLESQKKIEVEKIRIEKIFFRETECLKKQAISNLTQKSQVASNVSYKSKQNILLRENYFEELAALTKHQQETIIMTMNQQEQQNQQKIINEIESSYSLKLHKLLGIKNFYDSQQNTFFRQNLKDKIDLIKVSSEHELQHELKQYQQQLSQHKDESIIQYEQQWKQSVYQQKFQKIEKERKLIQLSFQQSLDVYKDDADKNLHLQMQKLELQKLKQRNERFSALEREYFLNELENDHYKIKNDLERVKIELQQQIKIAKIQLQHFVDQLQQIIGQRDVSTKRQSKICETKQGNLCQNVKDSNLHDTRFDFMSQKFPISKDQWIKQLNLESHWLSMKKERLRNDKKNLQKLHLSLSILPTDVENIQLYNLSVDQTRYNQQLLQNLEYILKKLESNIEMYNQTKMIEYLLQNENLLEDLQTQKIKIDDIQKLPIENSHIFQSMTCKNRSHHVNTIGNHQLSDFLTAQKQLLQGMKDQVSIFLQKLNQSLIKRLN